MVTTVQNPNIRWLSFLHLPSETDLLDVGRRPSLLTLAC
jgi:hypothetical protein